MGIKSRESFVYFQHQSNRSKIIGVIIINFNIRVSKANQFVKFQGNEASNNARSGGDGWNDFAGDQYIALVSVCGLDAIVGGSQVGRSHNEVQVVAIIIFLKVQRGDLLKFVFYLSKN
jgi:hypothetical protein